MRESRSKRTRRGGAGLKRRRLQPEARRVELLEAALQVLRSQGPEDARVQDITAAAGAAKGTFYVYFPSWEDLLVQVRAHILSKYVAETRKRFAAGGSSDWWDAFEGECIHFIDFVVGLGDLHKAIFHGPIADRPLDPAASSETLVSWMIRKGIKSGACRRVQVDAAAELLFAVLHTTADNIAEKGNRERHVNAMFDLLRAWLRAPATVKEGRSSRHGANPKD
jgi:AcrR family transcriptional regulator